MKDAKRPSLSFAALPAAVTLFLAMIVGFVSDLLHINDGLYSPGIFGRPSWIDIALVCGVVLLGGCLFSGKRSPVAVLGVLCLLVAEPLNGIIVFLTDGSAYDNYLCYFCGAVGYLGMVIVCARRMDRHKSGPWMIPAVLILIYAAQYIYAWKKYHFIIEEYQALYLGTVVRHVLLSVSMFLTARSFHVFEEPGASYMSAQRRPQAYGYAPQPGADTRQYGSSPSPAPPTEPVYNPVGTAGADGRPAEPTPVEVEYDIISDDK